MKVYITCPVSHTDNRLNILPEIKSVVEEVGMEPFVFQIGGTPEEIFNRDYNELKNSQIVIAEVSERSHGGGIEIGLSYHLGLKRILLLERGQYVSKLAQGIPDTVIVEYESIVDLRTKLAKTLGQISIG
jgi:nucleoside 2-deoxyribosyltransferase